MSEPCRLYLITPPTLDDPAAFAQAFAGACEGGDVAALQVRLKDVPDAAIAAAVQALAPIARARDVVLILNDRPDLAAALGCDGVHIGQGDGTYADARRAMGKDRIVGVTCHDSRHLAMEAAEAGADYVAFGAFFATTTKDGADPRRSGNPVDLAGEHADPLRGDRRYRGGENCRPLVAAGADFLAVSAGVWGFSRRTGGGGAGFQRRDRGGNARAVLSDF